jgi:hypothetical protein
MNEEDGVPALPWLPQEDQGFEASDPEPLLVLYGVAELAHALDVTR